MRAEKFVPYAKMSKKNRRALDNRRRGSWGTVKPVLRMMETGKYDRRKTKKEVYDYVNTADAE